MSQSIIKVDGLSKSFVISHETKAKYNSLGEVITRKAKDIFRGRSSQSGVTSEEFMALNEVSFEINKGDRVGIIGRNGAGKSTLLKVLSRITEPTKGRIDIEGRVASLLEVGTGFHPELTGRENIFLNGAILGMSRAEIRSKFDEIVAFAEVEKFLDTPVKRYSSGMYVRLAFAVAAHLEPEILIVDEVLAVGDAQFQKKCLGKMEDVSNNEGRTVLFVSHNMSTLKALCSSMLYLKNGKVVHQGEVEETIQRYLRENKDVMESGIIPRDFHRKYKTGEAFFTSVMTYDFNNKPQNEFHFGEKIKIVISFDVISKIENSLINILISYNGENVAFLADNNDEIYQPKTFLPGKHQVEIIVNAKFLPFNYSITALMAHYHSGTPIDWVENVYAFSVSTIGVKKGSDYPWGIVHGYTEPNSVWSYPQ
ncbi:MAG TPA: ABC transporter ATP-binding protein [Cyclobacteriaceae bacterium]|jgi:lipopolysaccharide transport system ATP-binding protein|nr:ABC transporter ATP-binding protein [Cyclobacteriaceae bacterium]